MSDIDSDIGIDRDNVDTGDETEFDLGTDGDWKACKADGIDVHPLGQKQS